MSGSAHQESLLTVHSLAVPELANPVPGAEPKPSVAGPIEYPQEPSGTLVDWNEYDWLNEISLDWFIVFSGIHEVPTFAQRSYNGSPARREIYRSLISDQALRSLLFSFRVSTSVPVNMICTVSEHLGRILAVLPEKRIGLSGLSKGHTLDSFNALLGMLSENVFTTLTPHGDDSLSIAPKRIFIDLFTLLAILILSIAIAFCEGILQSSPDEFLGKLSLSDDCNVLLFLHYNSALHIQDFLSQYFKQLSVRDGITKPSPNQTRRVMITSLLRRYFLLLANIVLEYCGPSYTPVDIEHTYSQSDSSCQHALILAVASINGTAFNVDTLPTASNALLAIIIDATPHLLGCLDAACSRMRNEPAPFHGTEPLPRLMDISPPPEVASGSDDGVNMYVVNEHGDIYNETLALSHLSQAPGVAPDDTVLSLRNPDNVSRSVHFARAGVTMSPTKTDSDRDSLAIGNLKLSLVDSANSAPADTTLSAYNASIAKIQDFTSYLTSVPELLKAVVLRSFSDLPFPHVPSLPDHLCDTILKKVTTITAFEGSMQTLAVGSLNEALCFTILFADFLRLSVLLSHGSLNMRLIDISSFVVMGVADLPKGTALADVLVTAIESSVRPQNAHDLSSQSVEGRDPLFLERKLKHLSDRHPPVCFIKKEALSFVCHVLRSLNLSDLRGSISRDTEDAFIDFLRASLMLESLDDFMCVAACVSHVLEDYTRFFTITQDGLAFCLRVLDACHATLTKSILRGPLDTSVFKSVDAYLNDVNGKLSIVYQYWIHSSCLKQIERLMVHAEESVLGKLNTIYSDYSLNVKQDTKERTALKSQADGYGKLVFLSVEQSTGADMAQESDVADASKSDDIRSRRTPLLDSFSEFLKLFVEQIHVDCMLFLPLLTPPFSRMCTFTVTDSCSLCNASRAVTNSMSASVQKTVTGFSPGCIHPLYSENLYQLSPQMYHSKKRGRLGVCPLTILVGTYCKFLSDRLTLMLDELMKYKSIGFSSLEQLAEQLDTAMQVVRCVFFAPTNNSSLLSTIYSFKLFDTRFYNIQQNPVSSNTSQPTYSHRKAESASEARNRQSNDAMPLDAESTADSLLWNIDHLPLRIINQFLPPDMSILMLTPILNYYISFESQQITSRIKLLPRYETIVPYKPFSRFIRDLGEHEISDDTVRANSLEFRCSSVPADAADIVSEFLRNVFSCFAVSQTTIRGILSNVLDTISLSARSISLIDHFGGHHLPNLQRLWSVDPGFSADPFKKMGSKLSNYFSKRVAKKKESRYIAAFATGSTSSHSLPDSQPGRSVSAEDELASLAFLGKQDAYSVPAIAAAIMSNCECSGMEELGKLFVDALPEEHGTAVGATSGYEEAASKMARKLFTSYSFDRFVRSFLSTCSATPPSGPDLFQSFRPSDQQVSYKQVVDANTLVCARINGLELMLEKVDVILRFVSSSIATYKIGEADWGAKSTSVPESVPQSEASAQHITTNAEHDWETPPGDSAPQAGDEAPHRSFAADALYINRNCRQLNLFSVQESVSAPSPKEHASLVPSMCDIAADYYEQFSSRIRDAIVALINFIAKYTIYSGFRPLFQRAYCPAPSVARLSSVWGALQETLGHSISGLCPKHAKYFMACFGRHAAWVTAFLLLDSGPRTRMYRHADVLLFTKDLEVLAQVIQGAVFMKDGVINEYRRLSVLIGDAGCLTQFADMTKSTIPSEAATPGTGAQDEEANLRNSVRIRQKHQLEDADEVVNSSEVSSLLSRAQTLIDLHSMHTMDLLHTCYDPMQNNDILRSLDCESVLGEGLLSQSEMVVRIMNFRRYTEPEAHALLHRMKKRWNEITNH